MSLSAILNTSLTGLFTSQSALRATGANIANVNTPGHSRLVVQQEALVLSGETVGVGIQDIERIVDVFLENALRTATSSAQEYTVQREFHDRYQGLIGRPDSDSTLSARVDRIFQSFAPLALNPADAVSRQATLGELQGFADEVSRLGLAVQDLRNDASRQIEEQIAVVNEQLRRIHELNPLIVREKLSGTETGGLESQRAQALQALSEIIDIRVNENADGSVAVSTSAGATLVDRFVRELDYRAPGTVTSATRFPQIEIYTLDPLSEQRLLPARTLDPDIRSGRLKGLLDLRDREMVDLSLTLGELSARVVDQLNAIHNANTAVPPPNQLVGKPTAIDGGNAPNFTGRVVFAVVDENNQMVATQEVDFDALPPADFATLTGTVTAGLGGAGTLNLTDGVMRFTATNPNHGVVIVQDPARPSDRAGKGFSHYFGMNDLMTTQVEGIYDTGVAGTDPHNLATGGQTTFEVVDANGAVLGSYTMTAPGTTYNDILADLNGGAALGGFFDFTLDANGALVATPEPGFDDISLAVVNDSTNHADSGLTFSALFGIGDRYVADAARDVAVVDAVASDVSRLAMARFDLSAAVGEVAVSAGDQSGALAFQMLETTVVSFDDAGELTGRTTTLSTYAGEVLASAGLMAERATNSEADNGALQLEVSQRLADVTGVNLDEELANLVVYQNSYNAAARIVTSVQELFDTLLAAV